MKPVNKSIGTNYWFLTSIAVFCSFHQNMLLWIL